ncbi:MAG: hypothetical protein AVDCRST_MAG78-150 [uncultured Rubrobacteraceae bacterium]|uniref:Gram-positive cocci surface proteins LPxTG domain-containing protein n=1 Tax=uncultured Rubrobacteraceae bacterium TaxID=349277 RepID=A0A6J4P5M7_9ACTN|nr:MAG: hypothetical protein AVDCRST_MAG78-150 [uncultured Rubrobacteraceae bacterium]
MKNLMIVVAFLVVALVAAPAIAQDDESTNPPDAPVSDAPGAPLPKASAELPLPEDTTPEVPLPETPPEDADPVSDAGGDGTITNTGPVEDTSDDGTITDTGLDEAGPGNDSSAGPGGGAGPGGNTHDDIVEDLDKDNDADAEKKAVDSDKVDAEDREDRVADRILADLKDGKKDKDDDDADEDGVEQSTDQDADSGDTDQDANVINTGDNVNQCVGILQVANTGNAQNATGITQFDSETDEIELEDGSSITLTPQLVVDCRQIILQIVKGERPNESKISKTKLREAIQPRSAAAPILRTGGVPNRIGELSNRAGAGVVVPASSRPGSTAAPKVLSASSAGQPKASSLRSLPRTGGFSGYATLLGLGAGVLLIGGGLLARRLSR